MIDYQKALENAYQRYIADVVEIARQARTEVLVPFLKSRRYEFTQGNGTWSVTDQSKIRYLSNGRRDWRSYDHDMTIRLPVDLEIIMRLEVEGSRGNPELALWMFDYTTENTKNKE